MGYIQSYHYHGPLDFSDLVSGLQQMIEADRDGDVELAAAYAEEVADLRATLRLIESRALHKAAEAIDRLDTLVRARSPSASTTRSYQAIHELAP